MRAIAPIASKHVSSSMASVLARRASTPSHQRRTPRHEGERGPVGQQHGADGADQRRQPVQPDGGAHVRYAERAAGFHGQRLHPIDADRLLVADLVLETDVDVVAGLQHLLGGLSETGLVAVDRGDLEQARQERDQREGNEHRGGAPVRGRRPVEHGGEPP
jgi:hypothetical protein